MRTLLTKMFRTPRNARPLNRKLDMVKLEDRAVPATFTFAGVTFDTDNAPSDYSLLGTGTYDKAVVSSEPTTAIETGIGFPDQPTGFNENFAIGTNLFGGPGVKALNLPAGNVGVTARSGINAEYLTGRAIGNAAGDDILIYESANSPGQPEAFMIQGYNVNTGNWTPWYYEPADSFSIYTGNLMNQGAFATKIDLSAMGVGAGEFVTKFRIVNMTTQDRMASATGVGIVLPNDDGSSSTFLPNPGPLGPTAYDNSGFDPDPLYFGALGTVAQGITNVRTTVTAVPVPGTTGTQVTYTVTIENLGSGDAAGLNPVFTLDPDFTPTSTTTTSTGGSTGNTSNPNGDTLAIPSGGTVTYVIVGNVAPTAASPLVSTFDSGLPLPPAIDPNVIDNKATSSLPLTNSGMVTVTITPGDGNAPAGTPITYTVTVANTGPSGFTGVGITDVLPPGLTGVTFTSTTTGGATGNSPNGKGTINDPNATLPPGSTIVYTVTGTIPPTFTGNIPFMAGVTLQPGDVNTDPNGGMKTVNTNAVAQGDLFVLMTASPTNPVSGQKVTYTITAGNKGPSTATSTLLADSFSAAFSNVSFTSVASSGATGNTPSGSGNLNQTLVLAPGSQVVYTVVATLANSTTGPVSNTATLTAPPGFTETNPSDNSATSTVNVTPGADIGLVVTPNTPVASLGGKLSYTVEVTNMGPSAVNGVTIASLLDPNILGVTFTSVASNGASGNDTVGTGNINDVVNLPLGGKIVYTIGGTVATGISGNLTSTFNSTNPPGTPDPNPETVTIVTPTQPSPKVIYAASTGLGVVTQVFVFNADGSSRFSYQPYDTRFTRGVNVGIGDVNGDGFPDVVTGTSVGGGSHVRAVDGLNGKDLFSFFAYGPTVRTGVMVTVNDINGDGLSEIITGSDVGGGPRIRVFDMKQQGSTGKSVLDFFAFDSTMNKGVRVASGNLSGDARSEIIVSAGPGGPSEVKVFNGATGAFLSQFNPFGTSTRGTYLAAADFDGSGFAEIVVGDDRGATPVVRVFDPQQNFKQTTEFVAYETNFKGGVRVATYNDDSISIANPPAFILTGPGLGGGPRLRKFTGNGGDLGSQFLIGSFDRGGIFVG